MDKYVCIKTIAPKGYSYFKNENKFLKLDEFFEKTAGYFINKYKNANYLFYYDNDTSTNLIYWFVYFKRIIMYDLDITVAYDYDFRESQLNNIDRRILEQIFFYSKIMFIPKKYKNNPYEYLKKISCNINVAHICNNNMRIYTENNY